MKTNKKALATYFVIIVIISLLMTTLILSTLATFFKEDHPNCKDYDFEVTKNCLRDNSVYIEIRNKGNSVMSFQTNIENNKLFSIPATKTDGMSFSVNDNPKFVLYPYYQDLQGNKFLCYGKSVQINSLRLMKC
ncbi:MAG: hypothetical protein ACOC16_00200 [Nanoarchaeota archaeon]